jgi:peroxiredoxin
MSRTGKILLAWGLVVLLASCNSQAAGVKIGDSAPSWSGLLGVDGKQHSLDEYRSAKLVVLVFTCNQCPVAKAYEDRLIAVAKDYQDKGVQLVAVDCNPSPAEQLDKMKQRALEKSFNFPYLHDSVRQQTGHDYGARVTPHVFVLDQQRKVAYVGAVDDNMTSGEVKTPYLRAALDALLSGKQPPKAETKAFGCGIKYQKQE